MKKITNIGIGGVMAEVAWISCDGKAYLNILTHSLAQRYDTNLEVAARAIETAQCCGVISVNDNVVTLNERNKNDRTER